MTNSTGDVFLATSEEIAKMTKEELDSALASNQSDCDTELDDSYMTCRKQGCKDCSYNKNIMAIRAELKRRANP